MMRVYSAANNPSSLRASEIVLWQVTNHLHQKSVPDIRRGPKKVNPDITNFASPIESNPIHKVSWKSWPMNRLQVPQRNGTVVPARWVSPAGGPYHQDTASLGIVIVHLPYTVVDGRRPSVFGRCCPCLEQSAASCHLRSIAVCLL